MAFHRDPYQPLLRIHWKILNQPPGKHSTIRLAAKDARTTPGYYHELLQLLVRGMEFERHLLAWIVATSLLIWRKRPRHLPKVESKSLQGVGVLFTALMLCISSGLMTVCYTPPARASVHLVTTAFYGPTVAQPSMVVTAPAAPVTPPSAPTSHTVAPGETLSGIAQALGWIDATGKPDWKRVWGLNLGTIPNPDQISVGMVLNLAGSPASTPEWPPPQPQLTQKQRWLNAAQKMMDQGGSTYMPGLIMRELIARDLTPVAAAGFAGNFFQESGYRPDAIQQGGDWAIGLLQAAGHRKTALMDFAARQGKPWQDPIVQIDYVVQELHSSESAAWAAIQPITDVPLAAVTIRSQYERAGAPYDAHRVNAAVQAYNAFEQALNS